jgi:putative tricarboxylic transport membrane protein
MYAGVGLAALLIARRYNMGSSVRMGPGFFPTILSTLLLFAGGISILRSFLHKGEAEPIGRFAWREIGLILGSIVLFGLTVRGAGLALSLVLLVLISALASRSFRPKAAILLAVVTTALSVAVFVKGLGLPFAILGSWFAR